MCGFWMQNSDLWTRKTSLYGSQTDLSLCECKSASLASDLLVSMCPNPHLCFFLMQYSAFWTRISSLYGSQTSSLVLSTHNCEHNTRFTILYGSQPSSVVFACKTAWLASELLVSMGPSPHVWFLEAKQRLFDRNNKSLWVPAITCGFIHPKERD